MRRLEFRATSPDEAERIREFMGAAFRTSLDAPAFEPRLIEWKYYAPRPGWSGSRSYVLESNGAICSHGAVWPMPLVTSAGTLPACQMIDWAALPTVPGSGMLLRREIEKLVDVSVAIGGSPDSVRVIPGSGYRTVASFRKYARVVRPFRQFRRRPDALTFRKVAKLGRSILWSLSPGLPAPPQGWSAEPLTRIPDTPATDYATTARSTELLRYLMACPAGSLSAYQLLHGSREAGYFVLNEVDGQTRIADIQVTLGTADEWNAAVLVATHIAARIPETCEIVANTSLDRCGSALASAGYRLRGEQPVFLLDRSKSLNSPELHITAVDYDDYFARFPEFPFAT